MEKVNYSGKDETKKRIVFLAMLSGILASALSIFQVAARLISTLDSLVLDNFVGTAGVFLISYHCCMLLIKLNRLQITLVMGYGKKSTTLKILNVIVLFVQVFTGLSSNVIRILKY
jgi:hypothetical protein